MNTVPDVAGKHFDMARRPHTQANRPQGLASFDVNHAELVCRYSMHRLKSKLSQLECELFVPQFSQADGGEFHLIQFSHSVPAVCNILSLIDQEKGSMPHPSRRRAEPVSLLLAWGASAISSPLLMAHMREPWNFTDGMRVLAIVLVISADLPLLAKRPLRGEEIRA
jgi:hypothetical protein